MRIRTKPAGLLLAVAAAVALAGCAGPAQPGEPGGPAAPAVVADSADCLASGLRYFTDFGFDESDAVDGEHEAAPAAGSVPDGFEAVQAVVCSGEFGVEIDGEQWQAVRETRYDGDLPPLLTALEEPSDAVGPGPCTADYEIVPELWLVAEDGQAVRAAWPTDSCGKTKLGVSAAIAGLEMVDENLLPVAKIELADPFATCLSQLPPGELQGEVFEGEVLESIPSEIPGASPTAGPTADPGVASDQFCP
ncbi:hypothetical protein [Herbiconiux sp. L3-i23]|uniref:hypothetical protein n=1 Tax=Herbiconiux sp. L3-i23 TaxID=2905871 RepID=UPI00205BFB37|nr:hypothetical protein [Herbiconiux sp. L3-i23]BDI23394.1 hypothetical protein L3i23_21700 [Herbiconiux sp. L3-i23]